MSVFKPCCLVLLCAVMLAPACARKTEPPVAAPASANVPVDSAPAAAAHADSAPVTDDGIFKYTITTDIDTRLEDEEDKKKMGIEVDADQIKIIVAMNTEEGKYPVKYDLDCEGDGEFEYKGLTENGRCLYKRHTGKHHIWVRGEIPAMYLCLREPYCPMGAECEEYDSHGEPSELDHSNKAIVSIDSWGDVAWKSMDYFAAHCYALEKLPEGSPDLRQVTDMSSMFMYAESFNQPIEHWNVSNVENMVYLFGGAKSFNQPLEKWDVSNVKYMGDMFWSASSLNQPLE